MPINVTYLAQISSDESHLKYGSKSKAHCTRKTRTIRNRFHNSTDCATNCNYGAKCSIISTEDFLLPNISKGSNDCCKFSGISGMVASCKPTFSSIETHRKFAIAAVVFSLHLLVFSSMKTNLWDHYIKGRTYQIIIAIQITISLIHAVCAIISSAMACRALCPRCRPRTSTKVKEEFPKKVIKALSSTQVIMDLAGIITEAVGLSNMFSGYHGWPFLGAGVWCGILFGVSGGTGIIASLTPSFGIIVAFMVLSIIASTFSLPLLVISAIGMASSV